MNCPRGMVCPQGRALKDASAADLNSVSAHLRYDVPTEIVHEVDYNSLNRTLQDAAWNHPALEPWSLFVALDEEYAISQDLPHSQRWPWDVSKGVYIPTVAHELHCVVGFAVVKVRRQLTLAACIACICEREQRCSTARGTDLGL